jgi:hypothetical protein
MHQNFDSRHHLFLRFQLQHLERLVGPSLQVRQTANSSLRHTKFLAGLLPK